MDIKQELYDVSLPRHIVFGDTVYFDELFDFRHTRFVLNLFPSEHFTAKVLLEEKPCKGPLNDTERRMSIFLAPQDTIGIYLKGLKYAAQKQKSKKINIDSSFYELKIDNKYQHIQ